MIRLRSQVALQNTQVQASQNGACAEGIPKRKFSQRCEDKKSSAGPALCSHEGCVMFVISAITPRQNPSCGLSCVCMHNLGHK